MITITPEPPNLSPEAEAGIVLIKQTPPLGAMLARARELQVPMCVTYLANCLTKIALGMLRTGWHEHCQSAATVWAEASTSERGWAAQEIIDAALTDGRPEGSA